MSGVKIFECAKCKESHFKNSSKGEKRFLGSREEIRKHLASYHHINRKAGFYGNIPGHKGNRTPKNKDGTIKDERSIVTQNCILYKEF